MTTPHMLVMVECHIMIHQTLLAGRVIKMRSDNCIDSMRFKEMCLGEVQVVMGWGLTASAKWRSKSSMSLTTGWISTMLTWLWDLSTIETCTVVWQYLMGKGGASRVLNLAMWSVMSKIIPVAWMNGRPAVPSHHYVGRMGYHIYGWSARQCRTHLGYTRKVEHQTGIL